MPFPLRFLFASQQFSAEIGDAVSFDTSVFFSDPDNDPLTYFLTFDSELPPGLSLDSTTGIISGVLGDFGDVGFGFWLRVEDPSGEQSKAVLTGIWVPLPHGPVTSIFTRTCRPEFFDCIQGYNLTGVPPNGFVRESRPNAGTAVSVFPEPPTLETTRASASVGYEGEELTPAISAFLRPADERMTGEHFGIARHVLTGDLTIEATLTYSQTGGVRNPLPLTEGDPLDFGAMLQATLFTFQLDPLANGAVDGSLCDWQSVGFVFFGFRGVLFCILQGLHPHVVELQQQPFELPPFGIATHDGIVTSSVVGGTTIASVSIAHDNLLPGLQIFIGVQMFQEARYGGEVDSQNTLKITFDNPDAVAPQMTDIEEPTFEPAPESGGTFAVSIADGECINVNGHGRIPVAIFGDASLDIADVDMNSVRFGNFDLAIRGNGNPACAIEVKDPDIYDDLVCHFLDDGSPLQGAPGEVLVSFKKIGPSSATFFGGDIVCLSD